jgi:hypothetical protein
MRYFRYLVGATVGLVVVTAAYETTQGKLLVKKLKAAFTRTVDKTAKQIEEAKAKLEDLTTKAKVNSEGKPQG